MKQYLRRFSVSNIFPKEISIKDGFNVYVEWIAEIFLQKMGKYPINYTGLIELIYTIEGDENFKCRIGVSVLHAGSISGSFNLDKFLQIDNDRKQREYIVNDVFNRMVYFAKKYDLSITPLNIAKREILETDYYRQINSIRRSDKMVNAVIKHRRNLYNTITYKAEIDTKSLGRKEVEIDTIQVLGIHDFPDMNISDFISQVPTFKTIGWQEDGTLLLQYGAENKLLFKKYWLNIENMQVSNEIIKTL